MFHMKQKKFKLTIKEIILIALSCFVLIWLIILLILKNFPEICEDYVLNVSNPLTNLISQITSIFPFSLTEIVILIWIIITISVIALTIYYICKKKYRISIHIFASFALYVLTLCTCYFALSGLNYNRLPINIALYNEKVDTDEFEEIANYFIKDFNYCSEQLSYGEDGMVIMPYSFETLNEIVINEYKRLDNNSYFSSYTPKAKKLISSYIFSEFHIAGMSFSLLGEANINMLNATNDFPFTLAHELAHQKGVMREEDANLSALFICLSSDDCYLRYSGYIRSISSILMLLNYNGDENSYQEAYETINPNILLDIKASNDYINSFKLIGDIGSFFNNIYLTLFGNGGTDAYIDNPTINDTGEVDADGNIIYEFYFSPYQKLYFEFYFNG